MVGQRVPYMASTISNNILSTAVAAARLGAAAASASLVDGDEGGLLVTGRTVRSRSCRGTECADHFERRLGC